MKEKEIYKGRCFWTKKNNAELLLWLVCHNGWQLLRSNTNKAGVTWNSSMLCLHSSLFPRVASKAGKYLGYGKYSGDLAWIEAPGRHFKHSRTLAVWNYSKCFLPHSIQLISFQSYFLGQKYYKFIQYNKEIKNIE